MKTVRLGEIAESLPCHYGENPIDGASAFDVVKVSNVNGEGQFHGDFEKRRFKNDQLPDLLVKEGELLVVKSSGSKAHILSGKTAICDSDRAGRLVASNFLLRLRVDESAVLPRFVWYVLNGGNSKAFVKRIVGASTYPNLKWSDYAAHPIPLPTLVEQRQIVDVLDRAESIRAKRRAALAQLDSLTQSIFTDLFGDGLTVLEKWTTRKLGDLLEFLTSGSRGWARYYSKSGALFLRIQNVRYDGLVLDDIAYVNAPVTAEAIRTRAHPGDVLLSITADLGRTAVVPHNLGVAFINQHLSILRTKALVPRFLSAFFASPAGQRQVLRRNRQAVKAGLNFDDIRSFVVPFPPIELQREFAHRVAAVEKLKAAQRGSLAEMDALFASLQHRAFTGQL